MRSLVLLAAVFYALSALLFVRWIGRRPTRGSDGHDPHGAAT
ncbi:MAG: hypothetical protein R3E12_07070 [Candidatus Eisenbacteria bacterium]